MQPKPAEYGLCRCGCGQLAPMADRTRSARGQLKGEPIRFIKGHNTLGTGSTLEERLWPKIDMGAAQGQGCWWWTAYKDRKGYGKISVDSALRSAHRVVYELLIAPIPASMQLDHLCENKSCVSPDHLRVATAQENIARRATNGHAHKSHCKRGHQFSPENTYVTPKGSRQCRACWKERRKKKGE